MSTAPEPDHTPTHEPTSEADFQALLAPEPDPPTAVPLAIEDWISVLLLFVLSLITLGNVLARYLTSISFAWTEEISIFLMMVLTLVAGSAAAARNRHIQIDYLSTRVSARTRRALRLICALSVVAMFAAMAWLGGLLAWDEYRFEETSPGLGVPKWIYTIWLPALSIAITLRAFGVFWRTLRQPQAPQQTAGQTPEEKA